MKNVSCEEQVVKLGEILKQLEASIKNYGSHMKNLQDSINEKDEDSCELILLSVIQNSLRYFKWNEENVTVLIEKSKEMKSVENQNRNLMSLISQLDELRVELAASKAQLERKISEENALKVKVEEGRKQVTELVMTLNIMSEELVVLQEAAAIKK